MQSSLTSTFTSRLSSRACFDFFKARGTEYDKYYAEALHLLDASTLLEASSRCKVDTSDRS